MKNIKLILGLILLLITIGCEKLWDPSTCKDIDGNIYKTVQIGDQTWMAENLRTTTLTTGISIPENKYIWTAEVPYYCRVANSSLSGEILYNWHTVKTEKICPIGWHVPTDEDWLTLEMFMGMSWEEASRIGWRGSDQGTKLKATYSWSWGKNGTDDYGFSATAPGYKFATSGNFEHIGEQAEFWTANADRDPMLAMRRGLIGNSEKIYRNITYRNNGCSIRCVKND